MFHILVRVRVGGVKAFALGCAALKRLSQCTQITCSPSTTFNQPAWPMTLYFPNETFDTIIICCLQSLCVLQTVYYISLCIGSTSCNMTYSYICQLDVALYMTLNHKDCPDPALSLSLDLSVLSQAISEELLALREFMSEGYARACHIKRECLHRVIESHTFMEHQSALCE